MHHLALHYLLLAHLLQNVILAEWAPLLAVLGIPPAAARAAARSAPWRVLTHPVVALPLWLASYFFWHVPAVYDAALRHQGSLLHLEHASYFATGVLMWWPLVQDAPRRLESGARVVDTLDPDPGPRRLDLAALNEEDGATLATNDRLLHVGYARLEPPLRPIGYAKQLGLDEKV